MTSRIQFAEEVASSQAAGSLRHPLFRWLGLRPTLAQHTRAEHEALLRHARGANIVVEIGVAEGASAAALRESMSKAGTLYLIDPYHLSRVQALNFLKRAAKRVVHAAGSARTVWIEEFSQSAVKNWKLSIDFLLIDGDHAEEAVERDWTNWSPFVNESGIVAFHDARQFPGGWTTPDYGPVRFLNRKFREQASKEWKIVDEVDTLVFVRRAQRA
jgi:predicted O-methyltransferase YrrM